MSTRIRYTKDAEGFAVSTKVMKGMRNEEYIARIHPDGRTGYIHNVRDLSCVATVNGISSHKTKIALKKALETLGVTFESEKRKERKNETTQITTG